MDGWYWAAPRDRRAGSAFIIEQGQDRLWARVRIEIDPREKLCLGRAVNNTLGMDDDWF